MGRLVETAALERGHSVKAIVDPVATGAVKSIAELGDVGLDVAFEFTHPTTAFDNIKLLLEKGIPVVSGTTGWSERLPEMESLVRKLGGSLVWSSNYSTGVELFLKIAEFAAKEAAPFAEYDIGGYERHHNLKADSPSGTAKTLVERVLAAHGAAARGAALTAKTRAVYDKLDRPPEKDELHFASIRAGGEPGTHVLYFDSGADYIEIRHSARTREGFAKGAIRAAERLYNGGSPKKGLFTN
jgi:4-hydroxy-tetrahydrodipicolinate reductase